jgi:SAM-dependent methyltransferase
MTLSEAIDLIRPAVEPTSGIWADIGAGTGLFTEALMSILEEGKVIAVDKSPHGLYSNEQLTIGNRQLTIGKVQKAIDKGQLANSNEQRIIGVEIIEADFNHPFVLPSLDGIIMANALHYAHDHAVVLKNVLAHLKPGGSFILIEYDTDKPNPPWVPNPVSFVRFKELCEKVGLKGPVLIGTRDSVYNDGKMYVAKTSA